MDEYKAGKDEQPKHEAVERPWASNDKVQFDNMISHGKRVDVIAEQSLQNAVTFQKQANDQYLEQANAQNKEALALAQNLHHQLIENNRYTLDRLYSVFPEEATGIATMVSLIIETLKQDGWTKPDAKS
jgi:hypothetical protein